MDNYAIADQFSLLAKLMDIHGENSFKSKSYSSAAFTIEKLPQELAGLSHEKIFKIKGIGESVGNKVIEILETGELQLLKEIIAQTPEGVLEMMNIKGLGPKKINLLWKEMGIDNIEDLQKACQENRIAQTKGFGEKTQQNILDSIQFQQSNAGKYLYAKVEAFALALTEKIKDKFPDHKTELTGDFRRQMDIIESLDWTTTVSSDLLKNYLLNEHVALVADRDGMLILKADEALLLRFYITDEKDFSRKLFETTGSQEFVEEWHRVTKMQNESGFSNEQAIFQAADLQYIPPYLRENIDIISKAQAQKIQDVVHTRDIKGLIHAHSNWRDGGYTIEEMA